MSAYINEIIKGLNANARAAILATAAAEDGRVPYTVHDRTVDALDRRKLIREVNNRNGGFNWCILTTIGKRVAAELKRRAEARQPAQSPAPAPKTPPARKELSPAEREMQFADAARVFAALHPAAAELVNAYQANAIDTVVEGGPNYSPSDIWDQIGAEPAQRLTWRAEDDPDEWATADGFNKAWEHLNALARAGKLNVSRWDDTVTAARDVMRVHSVREEPVILHKESRSWQVLYSTQAQPTGPNWADFPAVSVQRTARLLAGEQWHAVSQRLEAEGLARYGVIASSAGHALMVARKRWETEGPHSAWFRFLAEEAPAIEALRAEYDPTPAQERAAFEAATAAAANPAPDLTLADLRAIATGAHTHA
ncbi:hypothetical protein ACFUJY_29665 [Streptomyces sp. NPDC057249]|uniref:hypothetical protein n=1 Tax=Streptomyces sp. NPDC057249 TaxID=3346067 RepID=UPI0036295D49